MRIYILNTTRFYHEDFEEYPGAWFSCPVDFEEVKERLGVQSEEEIEIEDYELPFPFDIVNIGLHFFHKDVRLYAASCSEV